MGGRRRPKIGPDALLPLDQDQFLHACRVAEAAATQGMPIENLENYSVASDLGSEVSTHRFADERMSQAMLGVKTVAGLTDEEFRRFVLRFLAMIEVMEDRRVERWTRDIVDEDERYEEVNAAVIRAAAVAPLNEDQRFDPVEFFQQVKAIASGHRDEGRLRGTPQ